MQLSGKPIAQASCLAEKKGARPTDKPPKAGMNTKLHAICDSQARQFHLSITAGPVSDYVDARALVGSLPKVGLLLGGHGYDAEWFAEALNDKGIRACIPGRMQRKATVRYAQSTLLTPQQDRDYVR